MVTFFFSLKVIRIKNVGKQLFISVRFVKWKWSNVDACYCINYNTCISFASDLSRFI